MLFTLFYKEGTVNLIAIPFKSIKQITIYIRENHLPLSVRSDRALIPVW